MNSEADKSIKINVHRQLQAQVRNVQIIEQLGYGTNIGNPLKGEIRIV